MKNNSPNNLNIRTYSKNSTLVQEKRDMIADVSIKLFLEKGYMKTSIRDLAKACGWTEGAIYRYIGSKQDILHLYIIKTRVNVIREYLAELGQVDVMTALTKCIERYYIWQHETSDYNVFFNREIKYFNQTDRRALMSSQSDFIDFFKELIVRGKGEKVFHTTDPLLVAHNIVMMGFDWSLRRWYLEKHYTIDQYIRKQTAIILNMLKKQSS